MLVGDRVGGVSTQLRIQLTNKTHNTSPTGKRKQLHGQQTHAISTREFAYTVSLLHNPMDACYKLSMGLNKLKFGEIISML